MLDFAEKTAPSGGGDSLRPLWAAGAAFRSTKPMNILQFNLKKIYLPLSSKEYKSFFSCLYFNLKDFRRPAWGHLSANDAFWLVAAAGKRGGAPRLNRFCFVSPHVFRWEMLSSPCARAGDATLTTANRAQEATTHIPDPFQIKDALIAHHSKMLPYPGWEKEDQQGGDFHTQVYKNTKANLSVLVCTHVKIPLKIVSYYTYLQMMKTEEKKRVLTSVERPLLKENQVEFHFHTPWMALLMACYLASWFSSEKHHVHMIR